MHLSMLMRRDAEIWAKRMYFDHADHPDDLVSLHGLGDEQRRTTRLLRRVTHQKREEE